MTHRETPSHRRDILLGEAFVIAATIAATSLSLRENLTRYRELNTGWSWDLAYYNQWAWAFTHGTHRITVRPIADYATEGPPVWKTNYLTPIRYALLPVYALWPDPRTLIIAHTVVFWLILPAAFGLVRAETGSTLAGCIAVICVWMTPLLVPLAANDFRELQMALPFVAWAVHGVRARSVPLAVLGIGGVLACRQEYAIFVASLAILPPLRQESIVARYRWAHRLWFVGVIWMCCVFFGFLILVSGWYTPEQYLRQFGGGRPGVVEVLRTAAEILIVGLGPWCLLGMAAPRAALIALPWLWSLATGRWAMRLVATEEWHHVRYTAPFVAIGIAAGLLGAARLWRAAARFPYSQAWRAAVTALVLIGLAVARVGVAAQFARAPRPVAVADAPALWSWIDRVPAGDAVLAHYDLTAPLSSRAALFAYELKQNQPPGYPDQLSAEIRWVFCRATDLVAKHLSQQGFTVESVGPVWRIGHRSP